MSSSEAASTSADPDGSASWIRPGPTLLVASTGGHLDELLRLRPRFQPRLQDIEWATFDTEQSRHLLSHERLHFVPFVRPKDAKGTWLSSTAARRILSSRRFARVISTGAAVAVPFLATARALGMAAHYIESAARTDGKSVSGTILSAIPGVRLYSQYPAWASGRWQFRGSVFDGFAAGPECPARPIDKVVVTFGTQRGFSFRRALAALVNVLPEVCTSSPTILWQTGATDTTGLGIQGVASIPSSALAEAIREADLVISHSGVGSALMAFEQGKCPLLLPRRRNRGEHTDDHQRLVGAELARRCLAVLRDPDRICPTDLTAAATRSVMASSKPPAFVLQPG